MNKSTKELQTLSTNIKPGNNGNVLLESHAAEWYLQKMQPVEVAFFIHQTDNLIISYRLYVKVLFDIVEIIKINMSILIRKGAKK